MGGSFRAEDPPTPRQEAAMTTSVRPVVAGGRPQASAAGKKILLVDDDQALRQSLDEQLQLHEAFVTAEAATGGTALDLCKNDRFDAILLDVGLPDMDGREVCRLLRRNG